MGRQYSQAYSALTSASTSTSGAWFVGDFRLVTLSFSSKASLGASRLTVQGSNTDGLGWTDSSSDTILGGPTSNTGWSLVTGINMIGVTPGMVTFDPPGYRWLRVSVDPLTQSSASYTTATFNGVSF